MIVYKGYRYPRRAWRLLCLWRGGRPLTREGLEELEAFCRMRGIDINDREELLPREWLRMA
jgi:hypothetical protein